MASGYGAFRSAYIFHDRSADMRSLYRVSSLTLRGNDERKSSICLRPAAVFFLPIDPDVLPEVSRDFGHVVPARSSRQLKGQLIKVGN